MVAEAKKPRFFYGYIIVLVSVIVITIAYGAQYSYGVFFKPLSTEFGWTRAMTSGAYSLSMLLRGFLFVFAGKLNDKLGPRFVVTICGAFLVLGYLLMSQISTVWHLYVVYGVILAIGMSGGIVPLTSTAARWFVKRRGLMIGIVAAGIGAGTIIMPPISSWLITSYDWQTSYIIVGIMVFVSTIFGWLFLRREPAEVGQLPYGGGEAKTKSLNQQASGFSLSQAFNNRQFWMLSIVFFCFGFSLQVIMVHMVPYATDLGISSISAANILAVIGILSTTGRVIMGSASDRIGSRSATTISLILMSAALVGLLFGKELWMFYLFSILFGFGYGGTSALQSPIVAELFGLKAHGAVLGSATFFFTFGGAIGPLVAGYIFDIGGGYHLAFLLCVVLSFIAIALSLILKIPLALEKTK